MPCTHLPEYQSQGSSSPQDEASQTRFDVAHTALLLANQISASISIVLRGHGAPGGYMPGAQSYRVMGVAATNGSEHTLLLIRCRFVEVTFSVLQGRVSSLRRWRRGADGSVVLHSFFLPRTPFPKPICESAIRLGILISSVCLHVHSGLAVVREPRLQTTA